MDWKKCSGIRRSYLAVATGEKENLPAWTYSDIRTRLYPAAMSRAFPERALSFNDLMELLKIMRPSPVMEDI